MKQEYMYCIWRLSGFCSGIIIWVRTHGTVPGFKQIIIGDKVGFEAKFKITWLKAIQERMKPKKSSVAERIRILLVTLMRIRILLATMMRIRILPFTVMRIQIHNTDRRVEN